MAWHIIGHKWAVDLLGRTLAAGRVAHAYLFTGPPQVGKTTLALALAQALNCTQSDPPCGQCASCRKIARRAHPDLQVVVGEGVRDGIKIEQVRALRREAVLAPYEGRYRVFVLRQLDRASIEAANSLLKLLEEPPAHVILILTACDVEALPATIVSRCQCLDLRPVALDTLETALREEGVSSAKSQLLSRLSGGRVGWALDAARDDVLLHRRQLDLDRLVEVLVEDRVGRIDFAYKASRDPVAVRRRIALWTSWWRDLLLLCSQGEEGVINVDRIEEIGSFATQLSSSQALAGMRALQAAAAQLEANVNTRLAVEGLLLQLPHWNLLPQGQS
jgi:DNA polymerase-3 subunit delta'